LTAPFDKTADEQRRILADLEAFEPLLRTTPHGRDCDDDPVTEVADALETVAPTS
jgi:hypothetical protein